MKKIIAVLATLAWILMAFLFPVFWTRWKSHFVLEGDVMFLPTMASIVFWGAFTAAIGFLWYGASKNEEKK